MKLEVFFFLIEAAIEDNNLSKELKCVLWDDKGETLKSGFRINSMENKTKSPKTIFNCFTSINATPFF